MGAIRAWWGWGPARRDDSSGMWGVASVVSVPLDKVAVMSLSILVDATGRNEPAGVDAASGRPVFEGWDDGTCTHFGDVTAFARSSLAIGPVAQSCGLIHRAPLGSWRSAPFTYVISWEPRLARENRSPELWSSEAAVKDGGGKWRESGCRIENGDSEAKVETRATWKLKNDPQP